ncbi:MAG: hypothetical protein ACPGGG_08340 [Parvibaculales bacterium]
MRLSLCAVIFLLSVAQPKAQIIGNLVSDMPFDSIAQGDIENGFGFSGLRQKDRQRLLDLRQRYRELNPQNKGIVKVFDIDTPIQTEAGAATQADAE